MSEGEVFKDKLTKRKKLVNVDQLSYKTISANRQTVEKNWVVVDASNQILGRFSSQVVNILTGKNKTNYTPNVDCGDNVIVINAEKVRLTGKKLTDKVYLSHLKGQGFVKRASLNKVSADPGFFPDISQLEPVSVFYFPSFKLHIGEAIMDYTGQ